MRQLSGVGPAVLDWAVVDDKEATNKRATEEAAAKRATEERATEEATAKKAAEERAAEEATVKKAAEERVTEEAAVKAVAAEATGAAGGSSTPGQAPSAAGVKRAAAPPHRPNVPTGVFGNLGLSNFFVWLHSLITLFAQVLSLRCGHRNGHDCRRCGCRGGFGAGSCQRAPDPRRSP
jgi:hypothetical protein